jgi:acyl dehydratase
MVGIAKEVGPQRFRESFGRYYEDFTPGDVYEHRPGRTISEAVRTTGRKHDGTVFISFERTVLVPKRGHAVDDRAEY